MKKFIFLLSLTFTITSFSQKSDFWKNVRYGGGFTMSFGNQTTIGISPSAVYDFQNGFS